MEPPCLELVADEHAGELHVEELLSTPTEEVCVALVVLDLGRPGVGPVDTRLTCLVVAGAARLRDDRVLAVRVEADVHIEATLVGVVGLVEVRDLSGELYHVPLRV